MEIPLFLAMTAGEVRSAAYFPEHLAWMACHFSAYGLGLSNLPKDLPPGSMLILGDRIPICGHDPCLVAETLCKAARELRCSCILLDFQGSSGEAHAIIKEILASAHCPVGVSESYAGDFDCPVLLPPIAPHGPLAETLSAWNGREIWLELSAEGTQITVTAEGSQYTPIPFYEPADTAHFEEALHCHYEITVTDKQISFHLGRTEADWKALLEEAKQFGVTQAVGLWQELG